MRDVFQGPPWDQIELKYPKDLQQQINMKCLDDPVSPLPEVQSPGTVCPVGIILKI